jgi:hypothetical protein
MHTRHSNIYIGHIGYLDHIGNLILGHLSIKDFIFLVLFSMFCLSCGDLLNHDAPYCTFHIIGKPSMSRHAPSWFHIF